MCEIMIFNNIKGSKLSRTAYLLGVDWQVASLLVPGDVSTAVQAAREVYCGSRSSNDGLTLGRATVARDVWKNKIYRCHSQQSEAANGRRP